MLNNKNDNKYIFTFIIKMKIYTTAYPTIGVMFGYCAANVIFAVDGSVFLPDIDTFMG